MIPIIKRAGKLLGDGKSANYTALAEAIGCHRSSLYTWKRVPQRFVDKLVKATQGQLTAKLIRPDLSK